MFNSVASPRQSRLPHQMIDLDRKQIFFLQDCEAVSSCRKLLTLKLSHNAIKSLKGIDLLYDLRELAVDSNLLKSFIQLRPLSMLLDLSRMSVRKNPFAVKLKQAQMRTAIRNLIPGQTCQLP